MIAGRTRLLCGGFSGSIRYAAQELAGVGCMLKATHVLVSSFHIHDHMSKPVSTHEMLHHMHSGLNFHSKLICRKGCRHMQLV